MLLVAALNSWWGLGAPSLHIDEVFSWAASSGPLHDIPDRVRADEVAPLTYYFGLHEWIALAGSTEEWVMRLPSTFAAILLVLAVYRLAALILNQRAALVAGALTALSPLVLTYGQQVRAYIWAMLLVTIAVIAAVEAERSADPSRRRLWLIVATIAAAASFWTHYTAGLVVAPLLLWLATRPGLPARERSASVIAVLVTCGLTAPLMLDQLGRGHEKGIAHLASPTLEHLLQVVGTPFDGRSERLTIWIVAGAACVVAATVVALRKGPGGHDLLRNLILPLAIGPVLVVLVLTLVSDDVLISRYTAVAAPFIIVLLSGAITRLPGPAGAVLVGIALVCAGGGSIDLHRQATFYPDVRAAFERIADGYRPGDVVALSGYASAGPIGVYYRDHELPGAPLIVPGQTGALQAALRERRRLWFITSDVRSGAALQGSVRTLGYRPERPIRLSSPLIDLWVIAASPNPQG